MTNSLIIAQPQAEIDRITDFLRRSFTRANKKNAVIAVSGGIDSALSLTMLTKALSAGQIFPILLPYGDQNMDDARSICTHNAIPAANITTIDIKPMVEAITESIGSTDPLRRGNIMARTRMIAVYDLAKNNNALVCGTENRSEHHLGYFTRFGDAASDLEPICHLYKTQVRQIAQFLGLPAQIISKHPSAGLWDNQTDEKELGFSYAEADQVLFALLDTKTPEKEIAPAGITSATVAAALDRVRSQHFKLDVPYTL